jgi:HK97 family phage prohead protease
MAWKCSIIVLERCGLSFNSGAGPLLENHDWNLQLGAVTDVWIEAERGYARAKFSRSAHAEEVFQDVKDGIRSSISLAFIVHEMKLVKNSDKGPDEFLVTDYEPIELSLVSVPADYTVGVDRDGRKDFAVRILESGKRPMKTAADG